MAASMPPLPASLKPVQHYLKIANEHDARDPVVAYYCRLYAVQKGMEVDRKSPPARAYLGALMDLIEKMKKQHGQEEAVQSELVGQAHVENHALQMFLYADNEDRAGRFGKNVVKSFYTSGMLFDVLTTFGELSEDIVNNRKYAKWKAAYLHKCLKTGETPIAGPMAGEGEEDFPGMMEGGAGATAGDAGPSGYASGPPGGGLGPSPYPPGPPTNPGNLGFQDYSQPSVPPAQRTIPSPAQPHAPPSTPAEPPAGAQAGGWNSSAKELTADQFQQAIKFCKYASSALQYQDTPTAVDNLQKALQLLTTGKK